MTPEKQLRKTTVAVWDPEVAVTGAKSESHCFLVREDEVLLVVEFPTREALRRFLDKVASL